MSHHLLLTEVVIAAAMLGPGLAIATGQHAAAQRHGSEAIEQVPEMLNRVAEIHGAAGVFAVAGYRIGERALRDLDLPRGSFALEVVHRTPFEVQYSCIADGVQASTGVSAGKLNLKLVEVNSDQMETVIRNRKTGKEVAFRLQPSFVKRYLNLPREKQGNAGPDVAQLPESEIFAVTTRNSPQVH